MVIEKNPVLDEYAALSVKDSACTRCGECESRGPFAVQVVSINGV